MTATAHPAEDTLPMQPIVARGLRSNAVWMLIGNVAGSFARWMLAVLIAKLGTQSMVGDFGWALAFCLPTVTIFRFGLRILSSTDAANEIALREYLSFQVAGSIAGFIAVLFIGLFSQLSAQDLALVAMIGLWNSIESISELFAGFFQRFERIEYFGRANLIQLPFWCLSMGLGVGVFHSPLVGVCGLVLTSIARALFYELPAVNRLLDWRGGQSLSLLSRQFTKRKVLRIIQLGGPLTVVTFLMAFTASAPRYIIKDALGDARVGVFFALYSLAVAQTLVVGAVSQSLATRLATLFYERNKAPLIRLLVKSLFVSIGIGAIGVAVAAFAGPQLLTIVFTKAYSTDADAFLVLMVAGLVDGIGSVLGTMTSSMRRFAIQAPIQGLRLAITYFGALWAIQSWDLMGVAWAILAASVATVICYAATCVWGLRFER